MFKTSLLLLFLLFSLAQISLGQQEKIDSLRVLLNQESDVPSQVDLHIQLSFLLYDTNIKEGFEQADIANRLSRQNHYLKGEKLSLSLLGFNYFLDGNHKKAMSYYHESDAIASKVDSVATGYNYTLMANIYRIRSSYDSAEIFLLKAISILEKTSDKLYIAYAYKHMGLIRQAKYKLNEAEAFFKKSLALRMENKDERGIIDSQLVLGTLEVSRSNYQDANKYFDAACDLIHNQFSNNVALNVQCFFNDGTVHYKLGDFEFALKQLFNALDLLKGQNYTYLYAQTNQRIGDVYSEMDQHEMALKYLYESLAGFEKLKANADVARILSEIAWVHKGQLNFSLALELLDRSQKIRQDLNDEHGISNCLNIRGLIYFQQKKYKESLEEFDKSMEIRKRIGHREGVADVMFNMALVFEERGDLTKALQYQKESLEMEKVFGSDSGLGISYNAIGELLIRTGDYKMAEDYLNKAQEKATKTHSRLLLRSNYQYFSELFEKKGDLAKALKYRKKYDQLKDSVYSFSNSTKIAEMQALYQVEKKNEEIALQDERLKLQQEEITQKNIVISFVVIGILLISIFAFVTLRYSKRISKANREITEQKEEIQAQSEELIEANETIVQINKNLETKVEDRTSELKQAYKELDTFFYRSSHDFRRPITTFLGLAEVAKVTVKDQNVLDLFEKVRETALNLDKMLFKLQSISDLGAQQLVFKEVFVNELINEILYGFQDSIRKRNIHVSTNVNVKNSFYSYPAMVKIIIENLLENAILFCRIEDPVIDLKVEFQKNELILTFKDNGQGIGQEYQSRIFDMYYRANQNSKGNGLGLYIVKKAIEKLNGDIQFSSIAGEGSEFVVHLPSAESMSVI